MQETEDGSFLCLLSLSKESKLVLIAVRVHPFPSRTRQLSSLAPKILGWRRPGKIGNADIKRGLVRDRARPLHIPP